MPKECDRAVSARKPCCRRSGGPSVEPAVLAALLVSDGYGYDLRKTIASMTSGQLEADVGGIYRALKRLEDQGAVVSRWREEGSGPKRREYELTEIGVELARQWLVGLRRREAIDRLLGDMLEHGLESSGIDASSHPCARCACAVASPRRCDA